MKDLIICGKANQNVSVKKLRNNKDVEVWLCGTDSRSGADLYFEIHGIKVPYQNVVRKFEPEVYNNKAGLTVSNTISGMLIYAWQHGYKNITLLGAPMIIGEYPQQRVAVVQIVNYLNENGLNVVWEDINMAAKKNAEKKAEGTETVETAVNNPKTSGPKIKVKITSFLCGEWGSFEPGVYEIDARLALQFVNSDYAVKVDE